MFNNSVSPEAEQLAQLDRAYRTTQGLLAAAEQRRDMCPGYTRDGFDEEYRQACDQFVLVKNQLAEARSKITVSPAQRQPVLRLIEALRAR